VRGHYVVTHFLRHFYPFQQKDPVVLLFISFEN
jgi:hypothetical protein